MYLGHVVVLTVAGLLGAEGQEEQPKVPSEMKVLEKFVGEWDVVMGEVREVHRKTSILGGRFVESKTYQEDELVAIVRYTYDQAKNQYRLWFFNAGGMTTQGVGKWDAGSATLTFTGKTDDDSLWEYAVCFDDRNTVKTEFLMKDKNEVVVYDLKGKMTRPSVAGPPNAEPKGEASPPIPLEMKVLEKFVGEWHVEREDVRAVSKVTSILGGHFVESKAYEEGNVVAIVMYTYDQASKQYRTWFFNSEGVTTQGVGKWDADSATLTVTGKTEDDSLWTSSQRFTDDNVVKLKFLMKDKKGAVLIDFETTNNRQKK